MTDKISTINPVYFIVVIILTFIFPLGGLLTEYLANNVPLTFELFGKWFIFSAVGLRLLLAGIRQVSTPGFTARQIFHIDSSESWPIIRELGFANLCFGLVGIISLFIGEWRMVSAFACGLYYGFAAVLHLVKKPAGANEQLALWTDLFIFAILVTYFAMMFNLNR